MASIRNILFPVDFSSSCDAMAPFVQRVAAIFSARVTLLYVLEPSSSGFEVLTRPVPDAEEDRKRVACAKLETYLSAEFPRHEFPGWWWPEKRLRESSRWQETVGLI